MTIGFLFTYLASQEIYYVKLDFLGIAFLRDVTLAKFGEIVIYSN